MDPRHARYPFFEAAQTAVRDADVSPASIITADAPAVDRGHERVKRALLSGTVDSETPRRWSIQTEVLSYPVARILVSIINIPAAISKYAHAEAATARDRLQTDIADNDDIDQLQSTQQHSISFEAVLREFELNSAVYKAQSNKATSLTEQKKELGAPIVQHSDPNGYWIELGAYLSLADREWGTKWRLTAREVTDGVVYVDASELFVLIESAIEDRVASGLPFDVQGSDGGDAIIDALTDAVADLRELVGDSSAADRVSADVDIVAPGQFPPCMQALINRAREGEELDNHAEFALVSFLVAMDANVETVLSILGHDTNKEITGSETAHSDREETSSTTRERIATRVQYLTDRQGAGTQYPPPSCTTMKAYGDCIDPDERCAEITDPVSYYIEAIQATDNPLEYSEGYGDV